MIVNPPPPGGSQASGLFRTGFTLLELLVSMAVLALLTLVVAQLTNSAARVTTDSHLRMDGDSQARLVLDRLSLDFAKMLKRPDVDYGFAKAAGNDAISFYAESAGYSAAGNSTATVPRVLATIGYQVGTTGEASSRLTRGAKSVGWSEMIFSPLVGGNQTQSLVPPNSLPTLTSSGNSDFDVLGDQVFRLEYCYLIKANPVAGTPPRLSATPPAKFTDLAGIIMGVAVLDKKSRGLVSPSQLNSLISALPDAVDGQDIASRWNPIVREAASLSSLTNIPLAAASTVRVFQRYYYLPAGT